MTINNLWYDGPVTESTHAKYISKVGRRRYGVMNAGDLKVSPRSGAVRTVNIAAGQAWGNGILTTLTTTETLQLPSHTSAYNRWYMIVLRRNWSTNTTTIDYAGPVTSRTLPGRNRNPGSLDDQPLALVELDRDGVFGEIVDLRVWGSGFVRDRLAFAYLDEEAGATLYLDNELWVSNEYGTFQRYSRDYDSGWQEGKFREGWGGSNAFFRYRKTALGSAYGVDIRLYCVRTGAPINVPLSGDLANIQLASIPYAFTPDGGIGAASLTTSWGGRVYTGAVTSSGAVYLTATVSDANDQLVINENTAIGLQGFFITDRG